MTKTLGRSLGLYAVFTISVGAMIGSGIFVLPGLAETIAGPAVILAYLLAGLIVLPAALSKAEMATAMPEAGGTYLYIDRGMGPLMGTIAGLGAWFSLVFKSAFALVGLGAYLVLFAGDLPTKPVAIALAILLIAVNIIGVKQTGGLQAVIVSGVLVILALFIVEGITWVEQANYHPFYYEGVSGLLAATGFVFVSYAGVTKIASVAEEVENPGRNIPLGILTSIIVMMLIYTLIVFVIVGVTAADELGKTLTPMAVAAEQFLGSVGVVIVAVTAVLALTSMANAGLLSSSRYPFAMSRESLAPPMLQRINGRFRTPVFSIGLTGLVLLLLIGFVPVVDLAKFASAFQILVFCMVNLALIFFRESDLEWYEPVFRAPGYPWVQLLGIGGGLLLLTQMGVLPMAGAVAMILGGLAWYRFYGKERTSREGAALNALRYTSTMQSLRETEFAFKQDGPYQILIPTHPDITAAREETLLQIAADLVRGQEGQVQLVRIIDVPPQIGLQAASEYKTTDDGRGELARPLARELGVEVRVHELICHDVNRAVVNYARENKIDLLVGEVEPRFWHIPVFGRNVGWLIDHLPCDSVFVKNRGLGEVREIAVIGENGLYESLQVVTANAIAAERKAKIRFVQALKSTVIEEQIESMKSYQQDLENLCTVRTENRLIQGNHRRMDGLHESLSQADLVILNASAHRFFPNHIFGDFVDRISKHVNCTVLLVNSQDPIHHTFLRLALQRLIH